MLAAADGQDRLAADKSIALLYNVLGERRHHLGQLTRDYSWWDDAAVNLALSPNAEWAAANIGPYLTDSFNVAASIVLDPDNQQTLAFVQGVPATDHTLLARIEGGLDHLAADARRAPNDAPVAATGFLRINGEIHIAATSLIVPTEAELRDAYEPQRWAHVLVFTQPLDADALLSLGARFGLRDLAFRNGPPGEQTSSLRLVSPDSRELGFLSWRAEAPGYAMLRQLALPVAIAFDIMVVLAVLIVRQIGRLNRENRRMLEELAAKNGSLEQLTALQRATLDVIPDGIAVFDRDLCLLAWNQTFAELHDYPPDLLRVGVPLVRLLRHSAQTGSFPEPDGDAVVADHLAAAARCDPQPTRLTFADGRSIELRRSGASDGRIVLTYRQMNEDAAQRPRAATARELLRVVERSAAPSA